MSRTSRRRRRPTDPIAEGLGRAIRVLRTGRDLARRTLAERAGISYSYLAEIESGAKSPSARALAAIAAALGMPVHELVRAAEQWSKAPSSTPSSRETAGVAGPSAGDLREAPVEHWAVAWEDLEAQPPGRFLGGPRNVRLADLRLPQASREAVAWPAPSSVPRLTRRASRRDDREEIPRGLVGQIREGNCVAFVGAGFSMAARLPAWGQLLEEIAGRSSAPPAIRSHVSHCVERGSAHTLDEAAQVLEDELGRPQLLALLDALLSRPELTETMEHRLWLLRGIPFRSILTTNFDGVLAGEIPHHEAYRRALRVEPGRWLASRYASGEGAFTLKLHGDITRAVDGDGIVLTRRDYRRRLYEDPGYAAFLRAVMATTTVLYMGFSFEDAYLNELRSEVLSLLGQRRESDPVAYAIVNDVPSATRQHFARHEGIEILSYDTGGGRDFSGFDVLLAGIHDATNPLLHFARHLERRRILWVDPHPENNELAFEHLAEAARASGREGTALVAVATADEGLRALEEAAEGEPFDLAISHWGEDATRDDEGRPCPTAVRLLSGIRSRDLRCPVVLFAGSVRGPELDRRKRTALGLGAQAYCFSFETLYQTLERILAPGDETG